MVAGAYTIILAGLLVLPLGWTLNALFDVGARAAHLRWSWEAFNFGILPWLALLGALGMVAWTLLSRAYQIADVGAVAPFEYAYLPLAAALGYGVEYPGRHGADHRVGGLHRLPRSRQCPPQHHADGRGELCTRESRCSARGP
jgi:hypothetical protein